MSKKKMPSLGPIGRRRFMELVAGSLTLAAVGCGRRKDQAYSRGSTVTVAAEKDPMNPDSHAKFLVFLPLVSYTEKGELEGRLARTWEHSPDYREWTYHLRKDVRWHDGVAVTAHDIKFTLEFMSHADVYYFAPGAFESINVRDDWTVTVRTGHDSKYQTLTVYYPKHLLERLDPKSYRNWEFWTHPVGNGPYRFVRYLPQTMMEFEANPDYYRGKPKIERVVLKFAGDAGLTELLSGNVDVITNANEVRFPSGGLDPRFRVYHWYVENASRVIHWQNKHSFFEDARVRRALTLAINRRELLPLINVPRDIALVDGPYTVRQLRRGDLPEPLPYDPAQAQALLDAAGWRDRDGDRVRQRDGKAFRFTALVVGPPTTEIAVYVQDQFRRVGLRMDLQPLDYQSVRARLESGEFEAAFILFLSSTAGMQRYFREHSPIGYENPAVLGLIERAKVTADPDEEDRIYRELTNIFRADAPVTFLFPKVEFDFVHRRIRGLSSPWRADPVEFMEHLWLEDRSGQ